MRNVPTSSLGLAVLLLGLGSCAGDQIAMLGPRRPARPVGCPVEISPGQPAYPVVDLASIRVGCHETDRNDCFFALRRQACRAGGDTVYGLSESLDEGVTYIGATVALRASAEAAAPPAPARPQ